MWIMFHPFYPIRLLGKSPIQEKRGDKRILSDLWALIYSSSAWNGLFLFPHNTLALLLHSHLSVLSLVFISYNQPSLAEIPLTCIREWCMCSPSVPYLLFISTDFTTCTYPFFLLKISTISWGKKLCLFYYWTTICLTPTWTTISSIFKNF